jgi:hypothetical protein
MEESMEIIVAAGGEKDCEPTLRRQQLVSDVISRVNNAKNHHKKKFDQMRRDMDLALHGYDDREWDGTRYTANLINRHVQQRTAALYAKNPRAVAKRRNRLDFVSWDGDEKKLAQAYDIRQQAMMAGQMTPPQAEMLITEYEAVTDKRRKVDAVGQTLETLFSYFMDEAQPSFKSQMKSLVRRVITTSAGYVKLGFQREMDRHPEIAAKIHDVTARIDHLRRIASEAAEGDISRDDPEIEELMLSLKALIDEPEMIVREGMLFDFPESTAIIVDPMCRQLRGFVGARWIAHELFLTPDEVHEIYDVDMEGKFTPYDTKGRKQDSATVTMGVLAETSTEETKKGLVCVYEVYDKPSGLVYVVAEGHKDFLCEPASPKLKVDSFWPIFSLVFNEVEHKDEIFPPSDVQLIAPMQAEYNRARQGLREHRRANRPKYVSPAGRLEDEDKDKLKAHPAHAVIEVQGMAAGEKVGDLIQPVKMIGIDPNLYEVNTIFDDIQLVVGSQEAQFGGVSGSTATETSIAESARMSALGAQIDELDSFMSEVTRAAGQILLTEMSTEQVKKIVGPGAIWPELSYQEIQEEVFLEIEAGSTGKPNQAAELRNIERMLPYLLQMPGIDPKWLVKAVLKRLDDKLDIDEAMANQIPSIVAMNAVKNAQAAMGQMGGGPADPNMQGAAGGNNVVAMPSPAQAGGSLPAMGANNV